MKANQLINKRETSKHDQTYDENMNVADESWKDQTVVIDAASTLSPASSISYDFKAMGLEISSGYVRALNISGEGPSVGRKENENQDDLRNFVLYSQEIGDTQSRAHVTSTHDKVTISNRRPEEKDLSETLHEVVQQSKQNDGSFKQPQTAAVTSVYEALNSKKFPNQGDCEPRHARKDLNQKMATLENPVTNKSVHTLVSETPLVVVPEEPPMPETPAKTDKSTRISSIIRSSNFPATPMSVVKVSSSRDILPVTPASLKRRRSDVGCRSVFPGTPVSVKRSRSATTPVSVKILARPSIHHIGTPRPPRPSREIHDREEKKRSRHKHVSCLEHRFNKQQESGSVSDEGRSQRAENCHRKDRSKNPENNDDRSDALSQKENRNTHLDMKRINDDSQNEGPSLISVSKTTWQSLQQIQEKEKGQGDAPNRASLCPGNLFS